MDLTGVAIVVRSRYQHTDAVQAGSKRTQAKRWAPERHFSEAKRSKKSEVDPKRLWNVKTRYLTNHTRSRAYMCFCEKFCRKLKAGTCLCCKDFVEGEGVRQQLIHEELNEVKPDPGRALSPAASAITDSALRARTPFSHVHDQQMPLIFGPQIVGAWGVGGAVSGRPAHVCDAAWLDGPLHPSRAQGTGTPRAYLRRRC